MTERTPRLLPDEVVLTERVKITNRRIRLGLDQLNNEDVGVALSGGGIRSATLCLGLIQALAKTDVLSRVDYLSTVSGGGFCGAFIAGLFTPRDGESYNDQSDHAHTVLSDSQDTEVREMENHEVKWLRHNGRYLTPSGAVNYGLWLTIVIRNFIALHLVIGLPIFLVYYLVSLLSAAMGTSSYMLGVCIAVFIFLTRVLPLSLAYWFTPQEYIPLNLREAVGHGNLTVTAVTIGSLTLAGMASLPDLSIGIRLGIFVFALIFLYSLIDHDRALRRFFSTTSIDSTVHSLEQCRSSLSRSTSRWFSVTAVFAVVSLAAWMVEKIQSGTVPEQLFNAENIAWLGAGVTGFVSLARWMLGKALSFVDVGMIWRRLGLNIILVAGVFLWLLIIIFWGLLVGKLPTTGYYPVVIIIATVVFFAATALAIGFLNLSSLAQPYSARLRRAYLGASNNSRLSKDQTPVTADHRLDDLALADVYHPDSHLPILLINIALNQTIGSDSALTRRDRKGQSFSVGPAGIAVGRTSYMLNNKPETPYDPQTPVGWTMRMFDFRENATTNKPIPSWYEGSARVVEALPFSKWIGISGAAVSPGAGRHTNLGLSLATTALNVRLGYWWHPNRIPFSKEKFFARLSKPKGWTQGYLLQEIIARYQGKLGYVEDTQHRWYLSDGGHFDNTGLYELVRRELPVLILADFGADPNYRFGDFSILVRTVRSDFGATITVHNRDSLDKILPDYLINKFGTVDEFSSENKPMALLCGITYSSGSKGTLIVLKPTLSDQDTLDVTAYAKQNEDFPQQTTSDQFFDEAQWESYRALGYRLGESIFKMELTKHPGKYYPSTLSVCDL